MIMLRGLDHIGVRVAEFERAIEFYRQFGFDVIREDFNERVMVLRHASGIELNLLDSAVYQHRPNNVLMDDTLKYTGYTHIALQVVDVARAEKYVAALDIAIAEGPVTFGDGKTSIFIRDPDRNVIELTQPARVHVTGSTTEQELTI